MRESQLSNNSIIEKVMGVKQLSTILGQCRVKISNKHFVFRSLEQLLVGFIREEFFFHFDQFIWRQIAEHVVVQRRGQIGTSRSALNPGPGELDLALSFFGSQKSGLEPQSVFLAQPT